MSFSQEKVKNVEQEKRDELLLLAALLLEDVLGEEALYDYGNTTITMVWFHSISIVNEDAGSQGLPTVMYEDMTHIRDRALSDFRAEVVDLRDNPDSTMLRMQQTVSWTAWASFNESIKDIARQVGARELYYNVQHDERLCPICADLEGLHSINDLPELPVHPSCRCWWSIS